MNYNPLTITATIVALYVISYILITLFSFIFLGFTKKSQDVKASKVFSISALIALAWLLSFFAGLMFVSHYGVLVFVLVTFLLYVALSYLVTRKFMAMKGMEQYLYLAFISIIFNPGWLVLLKLL